MGKEGGREDKKLSRRNNLQHLEPARWEKVVKKKKSLTLAQGVEEEDMDISICDCSDGIHEEICLHFECHVSTLNNLQHTSKSPYILCMDTSCI